jgi:hypothetical protein
MITVVEALPRCVCGAVPCLTEGSTTVFVHCRNPRCLVTGFRASSLHEAYRQWIAWRELTP